MSNNDPVGFGLWVAFQDSVGTIEESIKRLKSSGANWVAPRAGQGIHRDKRWSPAEARESIKKYHDAGIKVYPWLYTYPNSCMQEIAVLKALMDEGADGIYLDAEIEWQGHGDHKPLAEQFLKALRSAVGDDCFIGHAPFPYVLWHTDFPYVEFGRYCDVVSDQLYWTEIDSQTASAHITKSAAQWKTFLQSHPEAAKVRCPIGVTYGHELKGVTHPPPGAFKVTDMEAFLDWCESQQIPSWSLYSLDAATPEAMTALAKRNLAKQAIAKSLVKDVLPITDADPPQQPDVVPPAAIVQVPAPSVAPDINAASHLAGMIGFVMQILHFLSMLFSRKR